jgi:hypothetical protein
MTKDDIIRMARAAGLERDGYWEFDMQRLERFAALVIAVEREACAALADAQRSNTNVLLSYPTQSSAAYNIGIAIRARGMNVKLTEQSPQNR